MLGQNDHEAVGTIATIKSTTPEKMQGRSVFPVSRMQKIIKADKVSIVSFYSLQFLFLAEGPSNRLERGGLRHLCSHGEDNFL